MEGKTRSSVPEIDFAPLTEDDYKSLSAFSCGEKDIDDFFHNEVHLCSKYNYLIPYKCTSTATGEIVGLFTLANDILALEYEDKYDFPNLASEYSDIFFRQPTYPAVNIGHLAVRTDMQSQGICKTIVDFVAATFSSIRLAGCQFVTVDALNNPRTLRFYYDYLGFEYQTCYDMNKSTRRMYLDIITSH